LEARRLIHVTDTAALVPGDGLEARRMRVAEHAAVGEMRCTGSVCAVELRPAVADLAEPAARALRVGEAARRGPRLARERDRLEPRSAHADRGADEEEVRRAVRLVAPETRAIP